MKRYKLRKIWRSEKLDPVNHNRGMEKEMLLVSLLKLLNIV